MDDETTDRTPQQLAAEGHWNGERVEAAHALLFGRVEHVRTFRSISMSDAVKVVHGDCLAGDLPACFIDAMDIYRRARAHAKNLLRPPATVSLGQFAHWMETGQLLEPGRSGGLNILSAERKKSFDELMAELDRLVLEHGLSSQRAAGRLVGLALQSSDDAPNAARALLLAAKGPGGKPSTSPVLDGLPSSLTVARWYASYRAKRVKDGAARAVNSAPRQWIPRPERWKREAALVVAAYPDVHPLGQHAELMRRWRAYWGRPISRAEFNDFVASGCK